MWTEPQPFDWRDAVLYEVMVDRYRAKDGSPLAPPASMGGTGRRARRRRAGGDRVGELQALGVNTVWLTPLYANPDGTWPGLDGNLYSSYHGDWPSESRALETQMAAEADVDALVASAHARRDSRALRRRSPPRAHQHPYWVGNKERGLVPGRRRHVRVRRGELHLGHHETSCWFTSYLPSFDWTNDDVATATTSDVLLVARALRRRLASASMRCP